MIKQLQEVFNTEIPLTNDIGIQVGEYTDLSLTLHAPLAKNTNHKSIVVSHKLVFLEKFLTTGAGSPIISWKR